VLESGTASRPAARASGTIVDPCIYRLGQFFLQGAAGPDSERRWSAIENDLSAVVTFFDLLVLNERLPAFNYTDTFDSRLDFSESLGHLVNVDGDQAVVPVNVEYGPYVESKWVALDELRGRLAGGPFLPRTTVADIRANLTELEYQWEPGLFAAPTTVMGAQVQSINLESEVPQDEHWITRYLLGHLVFSTYAQQSGMTHVLSARRSRHLAAAGLRFPAASEAAESEIFSALRKRVIGGGGGWRYDEMPWTPSFLPWLAQTQRPDDGPDVLLKRARDMHDARSVSRYRRLLAAAMVADDAKNAKAELKAAADEVADELGKTGAKPGWAHQLVVEIAPEAIAAVAGVVAGGMVLGPGGAIVGAAFPVFAKPVLHSVQERLWGWAFAQLPYVSARKLLGRTVLAENEIGDGLAKQLFTIWNA
jgi:hypothetical protein